MILKKKNYSMVDYIRIPFKVSPVIAAIIMILKVIIAILPTIQMMVVADFIDTSIKIFNGLDVSKIYVKISYIILIIFLNWICSLLLNITNIKIDMNMKEIIDLEIIEKRIKLNYKYIENNDTWDLIKVAGDNTSHKIYDGFINIASIVEYGIKILGILVVIFSKIWWVSIIVFFIYIPLIYISISNGKVDYDAFSESEKYMRSADYIKEILSSREYVEERHLFKYSNYVNELWNGKFEEARKVEYKATKKIFIKSKVNSIMISIIFMAIALILIIPVGKNKITPGLYISIVTSSFAIVTEMSWQVSMLMKNFFKNKLYIKDIEKFLNLDENIYLNNEAYFKECGEKVIYSIEFKDVKFAYPGTNINILNGLSMKLEKNKQYAFVGKNGVGKTTIINLLTGLYDNYEGEIFINNINIREITYLELMQYFSVVYQEFSRYPISIKDNIGLGIKNYRKEDNIVEKEIEKSIEKLDLQDVIDKFPKKINTVLSKIEENDADLSGGEWQKIALCRSLVSKAPVCILDEPTSALDPISESKLYKLYSKISTGKLTILITHRLGAVILADEILVLDNGKILEKGNHKELLNLNGLYKSMFLEQRRWYDEAK